MVTFHANNGTEDTATQKIFGGKGYPEGQYLHLRGQDLRRWATSADGGCGL